MGTYRANWEDVRDALHQSEVEKYIEGDFSEEDFEEGVRAYLTDLENEGMEFAERGKEDAR